MFYSIRVSLSLLQRNWTSCKLQLITLSAYKPPPPSYRPSTCKQKKPFRLVTVIVSPLDISPPPNALIRNVCVFTCVLPTGRSFLIVLVVRHASWPLHSIPAQGLPGGPSILPLITNGTRSPCHRVHVLTKPEIRSDQRWIQFIMTFEA